MFRLIILLMATAFITTGCATVNRGIDDHFRIDSVPQGAKVTTSIETTKSIRNRRKNKNITPEFYGCDPTPCAIQLSRLSEFTFIVENEGFEPVEMFVTSSHKRGSVTANTAASVATTTGTVVAGAAVTAPVALGIAQVGGALTYGTVSASTFGLIVPVETAVSAGIAAGTSAAPSTASLAAGALPPALAVTGGMLLIDAGTGANRNLYPNPVVLELTPKGSAVKYDPAVSLFKEKQLAQDNYDRDCKLKKSRSNTYRRSKECTVLKTDLKKKREALKALINPSKKPTDAITTAPTEETK